MDRVILKALHVPLISLALALVFNVLFFEKVVGISVFIFVGVLMVATYVLGLNQQVSFRKSWWLVVLILFFALMPGIRTNELLTFLNVCATLGLLLLLAHQLAGTPAFLMKLGDYILLVIQVPFRMLAKAGSTIAQMSHIHSQVKHRDVWVRVLKGTILAIPVLIVFGLLFSQADLAFSQFIKRFIDIEISGRTIQYLAVLLFAFVAALSFLSYIFFPKPSQAIVSSGPSTTAGQVGKELEVLVFLGLISVLFLIFIGFQITYLFGGEANIVSAGFTYAEYARRGFWELLAVTLLSLVVLLASEKYAGVESRKDKRFRIPALILIAEVGIIIVSTFKWLSLYIDAYGMTILRFYVAGFIMLLVVLFILLAVKFIKTKREQFFAFGTLLSIAGFLIVVNAVNPDAYIIKANMERQSRTGKFDVSYVQELSTDAEPWKIEVYKKLEGEDKQILGELLQKDKEKLEKSSADWQSANLSRARALKLLRATPLPQP